MQTSQKPVWNSALQARSRLSGRGGLGSGLFPSVVAQHDLEVGNYDNHKNCMAAWIMIILILWHAYSGPTRNHSVVCHYHFYLVSWGDQKGVQKGVQKGGPERGSRRGSRFCLHPVSTTQMANRSCVAWWSHECSEVNGRVKAGWKHTLPPEEMARFDSRFVEFDRT